MPFDMLQDVGFRKALFATFNTTEHLHDDKYSVRCPVDINGAKNTSTPLADFCSESNAEYGNFRNHSGNSYAITWESTTTYLQIFAEKRNDESDSAKDIKSPLEDDMQFKRPTASRTIRAFLRAGPRKKLYFDPKGMKAAVVTCGGLCPGLNTVIYHIVSSLNKLYGIHDILGIKGGFHGFHNGVKPIQLTEK